MPPEYRLSPETPALNDYLRLRRISGLSPKAEAAARIGLPNSYFGVVVRHEEAVIGMGRIIGDGGLFFQVVDIAVDPVHQGQGLGKAIVARLVDHLKTTAPPTAYVSLIADGDASHLYSQYGFQPTAPRSIGMALPVVREPETP